MSPLSGQATPASPSPSAGTTTSRITILSCSSSSEIGEGNPGRNSGFLLETALAEDADADNLERVQQGNQMISETLQDMLREVELSGENVDITRAGTFRAAASDIGARSIARYETFLQAAGLPFERLSRDELRARIGSSYFQEGLYSPHCYLHSRRSLSRTVQNPAGFCHLL